MSGWRIVWYSVLIWLLSFLISGFVVLPWYYLVLPIAVFWTTVFYFKNTQRTLQNGLLVSLFWFFVILGLNFLEIIGPYYSDLEYYFSDFRNWLLYPLILLIPFILGIIWENSNLKNRGPGHWHPHKL